MLPDKDDLTVIKPNRIVFTDLQAMAASDASVRIKQDLRNRPLGFGIGTPLAPEGASFQEDQCPDAGAVMNGKPLDIEYDAR